MKLPALCIAASFAGGITLGRFTPLSKFVNSVPTTRGAFLLALAFLAASVLLLYKKFVVAVGSVSLSAWLTLGVVAAWCGSPPCLKIMS